VVYRALSYRFTVDCDDPVVGEQVAAMFGALREDSVVPGTTSPPAAVATAVGRYALRAATTAVHAAPPPGALDVWRDDVLLAPGRRRGDALSWVVRDVNPSAAEASGHHLLFHAAALESKGTGLVLPGASGSGKSTLATALTAAGLHYLTDELTALDLPSDRLLPYPKPITVKPGSFSVLVHPGHRTRGGGATGAGTAGEGAEWQLPVGVQTGRRVGRACRPRWIVLPRYDPAAPTTSVRLSQTEAFLALALNAVNLLPHGARGTAALGAMVAGSTCVSLTYSDLVAACALVLGLVETVSARAEGRRVGAEAGAGAL
jgi:energy-coupling factor transporter ATP-binding protein EcfA2